MYEIITSKIAWTTLLVSGLAIPIFGGNVILVFGIIYFFLMLYDTLTGLAVAKKNHTISSKISINGAIQKSLILIFILLLIAMTSGVLHVLNPQGSNSDSIQLLCVIVGLFPHGILIYFMWGEFISILENMSILYTDSHNEKLINTLNYLAQKVFNLSLDKLKENAEKKIEKKFK